MLGIDLEGCGLQEVTSDDLKPFSNLLQLSLDDNRLKQLPHDLFVHNKKLERIDLGGNWLMHVGPEIFSHLPQLATVYMRHNPCTSENTFALVKEDLKELEWELTVECPPTQKMLADSLFNSAKFIDIVRKVLEESSEEFQREMMIRLDEVERSIQDFEDRM